MRATRPPGWARAAPGDQAAASERSKGQGLGEGGQHSQTPASNPPGHKLETTLAAAGNRRTGLRGTSQPRKPRMPGKKTPPLPDGAAVASAWALVSLEHEPPCQAPLFRTPGRLHPHTQSPAPEGGCPKERAFQDTNNAWALLPRAPESPSTRGWAQAPLPEGTREHRDCAHLARVPGGGSTPG